MQVYIHMRIDHGFESEYLPHAHSATAALVAALRDSTPACMGIATRVARSRMVSGAPLPSSPTMRPYRFGGRIESTGAPPASSTNSGTFAGIDSWSAHSVSD